MAGLPAPIGAEPALVPTNHGLRLDDDDRVQERRVQSIQPCLQPGAVLKDFLVVDQYELGAALNKEMMVAQIPFSRNFLETRLRLNEPTHASLLAVEAGSNLLAIERGDLVLIDRKQATLARDGIYLLDLPGIELRAIFRRPDGKVDVVGPRQDVDRSAKKRRHRTKPTSGTLEMSIRDLLGIGRHVVSKVVGRAVWVGRAV